MGWGSVDKYVMTVPDVTKVIKAYPKGHINISIQLLI